MILPSELSEKINELCQSLKTNEIKKIRENLTYKYKNKTGKSTDLIVSNDESITYAISRMPATYSVLYTLISELIEQKYIDIQKIDSISDFGSGTGSGYFALRQLFKNAKISLFEKNENMIKVFNFLSNVDKDYVYSFDLTNEEINEKFDFILSSYVLSELNEKDRQFAFKKLLNSSNKYVLIVDTGTPNTYKSMMSLKKLASELGFNTIAPCNNLVCPLQNDYCQFYARVERSKIMRQSKSGSLPYEDEKYFYLLFAKDISNLDGKSRIIRRPIIRANEVELKLCTLNGVETHKFTIKYKDKFKQAKKSKINGLI